MNGTFAWRLSMLASSLAVLPVVTTSSMMAMCLKHVNLDDPLSENIMPSLLSR
tara:strand:+ start:5771 stop:5929 length:159 start_codon:yes stop_codon:yes gene_type:complete